jgi:hypothetical protein
MKNENAWLQRCRAYGAANQPTPKGDKLFETIFAGDF